MTFNTMRALALMCLTVSLVTARSTYAQDATNVADQVTIVPLSPDITFARHVVGAGGSTAGVAGERLIYSNTRGTFPGSLGAGRLVSDDIATTAAPGCKLRRLEFPVVGKVDPNGLGGPYSVTFAIYSSCPYSVPIGSRPGLILPGSESQIDFPDDAPRLISFIPATDVPLPTNFWFGVKFSRNNAGVVMGAPPDEGFSADSFDFPQFACSANLGGFPEDPHGSFNLQIFGDSECAHAFAGYKNHRPNNFTFNPGANVFFADDIQLGVGECRMIAYEVTIKGPGFYTFQIRNSCDGAPTPGTEKSLSIPSGTDTAIARFNLAEAVPLPQNFWFASTVSNIAAGVVITGQRATIGRTEDLIGFVGETGECHIIDVLGSGRHAAFDLSITCAGQPPTGACCDMVFTDDQGEAVCREVPQMNCPWPPRYSTLQPPWAEGASCDSDPFAFPCGSSACCTLEASPDLICRNLTKNECEAAPSIGDYHSWQKGGYCGVGEQDCPEFPMACRESDEDCFLAHDTPGCENELCCAGICLTFGPAGAFCCEVEWDQNCVSMAQERCRTNCPVNSATDADGDGVGSPCDLCPWTRQGVAVDETGCAIQNTSPLPRPAPK